MFKNLSKNLKSHHVLVLLGLLVLFVGLNSYSKKQTVTLDGMYDRDNVNKVSHTGGNEKQFVAKPANPAGHNEVFASAKGMKTSDHGLPPSCAQGASTNPVDLLPKDVNSEWARLNPASGQGDFANVNLLKAGYHMGIDTVGGTLRNANLQVRSEPPNPVQKVSPWMNTTIEPDLMRVPLEIGCGPQ